MLLMNQTRKIPLILPFHHLPHFRRPSSYDAPSFVSSFRASFVSPLLLVVLLKLIVHRGL